MKQPDPTKEIPVMTCSATGETYPPAVIRMGSDFAPDGNPLPPAKCALCWERPTFSFGPVLVLMGDEYRPLCPHCGEDYAPGLQALVQLATRADGYRDSVCEAEDSAAMQAALDELKRAADDYLTLRDEAVTGPVAVA